MTAVISPPWVLPLPPEDDMEGQAAWFAEHQHTIRAIDHTLWHIKRRLMQGVKDAGPMATPHGRVEIEPKGYDWDAEAVLAVMPALISDARMSVSGPATEVTRAESLLSEETPSLKLALSYTVDATAANRVIRMKGDGAALLEPCRTPKGKLGVTR